MERNAPHQSRAPRNKILTCETWVTKQGWWAYAKAHPDDIPFPLLDRSPCQEPFLDPYGVPGQRVAVVSGLCRKFKRFVEGDRLIYITRVPPTVLKQLGRSFDSAAGPLYLGVAAIRVREVFESHNVAAAHFSPRQYVPLRASTPYPPNLAHERTSVAAAPPAACVLALRRPDGKAGRIYRLPSNAAPGEYERHYCHYHSRQAKAKLRAFLCEVETVDEKECLAFSPDRAPLFTPAAWGGRQMLIMGLDLDDSTAASLQAQIAAQGAPVTTARLTNPNE